ncbi:MAG: dTMP kinase [candidate division Zixibacteria bacterium]|nr:dTMP kinase [candidate division Zixibacteria bacterium]
MKRRGFLITFEGIDGSGKTTQLRLTEKYLHQAGFPLLILREPGSIPVAEKIRKILLNKRHRISPLSELLLYLAARAELVDKVIKPALDGGTTVLCDRFYDSTTAYQGYGRCLDIKLINKLNHWAVGESVPDITFLIDVNYQTSLRRRKKKSDRLESESKSFFNRVRRGFLIIAKQERKRIVVIDGDQTANVIFHEVSDCLKQKLKLR